MAKKFSNSAPDEAPKPTFMERLKSLAPAGVRVGAGILGAEGGLLGAGISGGGESLAEWLEGSDQNPARIGVEAGLGAIPFGKVFKAGKAISTGLKSGVLASAGETGREWAKGEKLNPTSIATTGVVGGLSGGLLSKFLGMGGSKAAQAVEDKMIVEPTAQEGGQILTGTKKGGLTKTQRPFEAKDIPLSGETKSSEIPYNFKEIPEPPTQGPNVPFGNNGPNQPYRSAGKAAQRSEDKAINEAATRTRIEEELDNGGNVSETFSAPNENGVGSKRATIQYNKPEPPAKTITTKPPVIPSESPTSAPSGKAAQDIAERRINNQGPPAGITDRRSQELLNKFGGGSVPESTPIPGISPQPKVTSYTPPSIDEPGNPLGAILSKQAREARDAAAGLPPTHALPITDVHPQVIPEPSTTPLGKVLSSTRKSRKTVEGFQQGVDKILGKTPEIAPEVASTLEAEVPSVTNKLNFFKTKQGAVGQNYRLAKEAEELGEISSKQPALDALRREQSAAKAGKPQPQVPTPGVNDSSWIGEQNSLIDRMRSESGEISPLALRSLMALGGVAVGAPVGAQLNDQDRTKGAIIGGTIGGGLAAFSPNIVNSVKNLSLDPESINSNISALTKRIPSIQRANLLTSSHGLPANAVVGPYGSAVMGSLEKGLSGDERGWEALGNLHPVEFLKKWKDKLGEARGLIGRAEGTSLDAASSQFDKALAAPGTAMTAGDLAAKDMLEQGGRFTPEETSQMTLTSEPITKAGKNIARLSKQSPLLQFMFPFSRTTTNIAEQGAKRIPGLGFMVSKAMENQGAPVDSLRAKLVQQGLGLGVGAGSYELADNLDPETAKIVKRYVSNGAGQYSLPATIGFSAGQAHAMGRNPITGGAKELGDALPLPTSRPITDLLNTGADLIDENKDWNQVRVPHSMYPAAFREIPDNSNAFGNLFSPPIKKGKFTNSR